MDLWLDKILRRIAAWLSSLGRRGGAGFSLLSIFVYGALAAGIIMVFVWTLMRLRRRPAEAAPREIIPFAPSAKGWRSWLSDARAAAQEQNWREAIHLAYWAGISILEEHGAWKPSRARTPREYLRLLGTWTPQHPPLAALTRKFEVVWYGDRPAGEPDFEEAIGELERLGCR